MTQDNIFESEEANNLSTPLEILEEAALTLKSRGVSRDTGGGAERSMTRAVATFNAAEGLHLTERQGWIFMVCLKLARAKATRDNSGWISDDYVDLAGYSALAAEGALAENQARLVAAAGQPAKRCGCNAGEECIHCGGGCTVC